MMIILSNYNVISILVYIMVVYSKHQDAETLANRNNEIVLRFHADNGLNVEENIKFIEKKYNFTFVKHLFNEYYLFEINFNSTIKSNDDEDVLKKHVKWAKIQNYFHRVKRDFVDDNELNEMMMNMILQSNRNNYFKSTYELNKLDNLLKYPDYLNNEYLAKASKNLDYDNPWDWDDVIPSHFSGSLESIECFGSKYSFNDPYWNRQWYMNDGCVEGRKMNITGAWDQGYTGRNIVLTIVDDGVEGNNFDLVENFDFNASLDINGHGTNPQPRYDLTDENKHGTRCAGEISGTANNSFCGVGVAYRSSVGGIRLLDGRINDRMEAEAIGYKLNYIDIFSASWGPLDDGKTVEGPGHLTSEAIVRGINEGRNGKGTIYVWASGNGGHLGDNCNCDGYASSIHTITISSATRDNEMPIYSEKCASILASTYSSGKKFKNNIVTADLHNRCTSSHSGTSASAPLAAGIIALALEANGNLTWRDIQHLIVYSSNSSDLKASDWYRNGIGKMVSHSFGFGLLNAGKLVELARNWKGIDKQLTCTIEIKSDDGRVFMIDSEQTSTFLVTVTNSAKLNARNKSQLLCSEPIKSLEHVISKITLTSGIRGDIRITLSSPSGTPSNLVEYRYLDKSSQGFVKWPFMSVHYWGERVTGEWKLKITNRGRHVVFFKEWSLIFHGTEKRVII